VEAVTHKARQMPDMTDIPKGNVLSVRADIPDMSANVRVCPGGRC
jgi:hypothetical protein